ncbi:UDP-N-acetylglucosamine--undecaprenyl-phosphate N-acetylglucosaminephosphotransferase [Parasalinivibrio latis]
MDFITTFVLATTFIFIGRRFAYKVSLLDQPDARKHHEGAIPLVGGIAICLTLVYYLHFNSEILESAPLYMLCITVLTLVGALDDKYDVSYKLRMAIQLGLSVAMMQYAELKLESLGNLLGFGDIHLGPFSYVVTVFAVVGAINAFNMVDGIDGLLGGLSLVTFSTLGFLLVMDGNHNLAYFCAIISVAMMPYILMNLGVMGRRRKVFMGDAGSMLIGFSVIWFILSASQGEGATFINPVTALWLIAVPLMDMATIMIRRIRKGHSPFKPDREHLHHIFQRLGMTRSQTLATICLIALAFAGVGILGEYMMVPEVIMFSLFMCSFAIYFSLVNFAGKRTSDESIAV